MKKKKIMIDMDDVICKGGFLHLLNKFMGTDYKEEDFKEYYMQDILPNKSEFYDYYIKNNMYDHCVLIDGAKEVIEKLSEKYEVYIGTAYIIPEFENGSEMTIPNKYKYLRKNLPFIPPSRYVFITNKSLLNCEIKIDDKISNLDEAEVKLLFNAYHNKDIPECDLKKSGVTRVSGWHEVANKLL